MKRILLPVTVALMLLGTAACSSTGAYNRQTDNYSGQGSDRDMHAAGRVCDSKVGAVQVGQDVPEAYKQCMHAQGWEYASTTRSLDSTPYPDPEHPDLMCRDVPSIFGMVGQFCSNF